MKTKMKITENDYIKANRKGSRDAELMNRTGWISIHKVHKTKKDYNRKNNKIIGNDDFVVFIC